MINIETAFVNSFFNFSKIFTAIGLLFARCRNFYQYRRIPNILR